MEGMILCRNKILVKRKNNIKRTVLCKLKKSTVLSNFEINTEKIAKLIYSFFINFVEIPFGLNFELPLDGKVAKQDYSWYHKTC